METTRPTVRPLAIALLSLSCALAAFAANASGATIVVDDDGGLWADAESIGEGLALAGDGDEVLVFEGTYRELVEVNASVSLAGNGTNASIIDGGFGGDVVTVRADGVTLSGFRIRNSEDGGCRAVFVFEADGVTVEDCALVWSSFGLLAYGSRGLSVVNDSFSNNSEEGLRLDTSEGATVSMDRFADNGVGVRCMDVDGVALERNRVARSNDEGIAIESGSNCSVRWNKVLYNGDGILLSSCGAGNRVSWNNVSMNTGAGVSVQSSDGVVVRGNEVSRNGENGILAADAVGGAIVTNNLTANLAHGIHLTNCEGVRAVGNRLVRNNGTDAPQAWDGGKGAANRWNGSRTGNHWGDLKKPDTDGDGVVDGPYPIGGGKGAADRRPLVHPWTPAAAIDAIDPTTVRLGDAVTFTGGGTDPFGGIASFAWRSSVDGLLHQGAGANFTTDDLSPGRHVVTLRAWNLTGNRSLPARAIVTVLVPPTCSISAVSPSPALEGTSVNLSANAGDADGRVAMYVWNSSRAGNIYAGPWPSVLVGGLRAGDHTITLSVQDDSGLWSGTASAPLNVTRRPTAAIVDIDPNPDTGYVNITFTGMATDDGEIVLFSWSSSVDGEFHNGTEMSVAYGGLSPGSHLISFRALDERGFWSHPAERQLLISKRPRAYLNVTAPEPAMEGDAVTFECSGFDPDGNVSWISLTSSIDGELHRGIGNAVRNVTLSPGRHEIQLVVQDEHALLSDPAGAEVVVNRRLPDVAILRIATAADPVLGSPNAVNVTLSNVGFIDAADVSVEFRVGAFTTFVVADVPLEGNTTVTFEWTPAVAFNVTLSVEASTATADLDPSSNARELRVYVAVPPTPLPDLVVDSLIVDHALAYINATIRVDVTNIGNVAADGVVIEVGIVGGPDIGRSAVDRISPGETRTVDVTWIAPASGSYSLRAAADPDDEVEEIFEFNNDLTGEAEVELNLFDIPVIDLWLTKEDLTVWGPGGEGEKELTAYITINMWHPLDGDVIVKVRTFLDGTPVEDRMVPMTGPSRTIEVPLVIPPGDHLVTVQIDPDDDIEETDEENNHAEDSVEVERPAGAEEEEVSTAVYATVAALVTTTMLLLWFVTRTPERPKI